MVSPLTEPQLPGSATSRTYVYPRARRTYGSASSRPPVG